MVQLDPRFSKTEYAVEADPFSLWEKYSTEAIYKTPNNVVQWEEDCAGVMTQIGTLNDRPITLDFRWAKLNGHLIMFYDSCSQLVDWKMIEEWLDKFTKFPRCDANNFHNVLHLIEAFHEN